MILLQKDEVLAINKLVKKKEPLDSFIEHFSKFGYSPECHDEIFDSLLISKEEIQKAYQKKQNRAKQNPTIRKALSKLYDNRKSINAFYAELKSHGIQESTFDETLELYGYSKNEIDEKSSSKTSSRTIGIVLLVIFGGLSIALFNAGWIIGITLCLATLGFYMAVSGEAPS